MSSAQTSSEDHEEQGTKPGSPGVLPGGQPRAGGVALTFAGLLAFCGCGGLLIGGPFDVFIRVRLGIFQLRPGSHGLWMGKQFTEVATERRHTHFL